MSKWIKAINAFAVILLVSITFLYLRDYYWAMKVAKEYEEKGDYEGMRSMLDFAHTRIRNMLRTLFVFILMIMGPIYYNRKKRSRIKQ